MPGQKECALGDSDTTRMTLQRHSGFTLIELMVTLTVVIVLLMIAVPSFQAVINSNRLSSAANELVAGLQAARIQAVRFDKRAVVCLSTNANTGSPTCAAANATNATGWIVFVDADKNSTYNTGDTLLRIGTVNSAVKILGSSNLTGKTKVIFRSDGLARASTGGVLTGTVDMCITTKHPSENVRHVSIRSGSVSVSRAAAGGACNAPTNST